MFPHFLKEREIISPSPQVFASSCFCLSLFLVLVLIWSFFWFGLVLHGGRGGAHIAASSLVWMHVCQLVDVMCDDRLRSSPCCIV